MIIPTNLIPTNSIPAPSNDTESKRLDAANEYFAKADFHFSKGSKISSVSPWERKDGQLFRYIFFQGKDHKWYNYFVGIVFDGDKVVTHVHNLLAFWAVVSNGPINLSTSGSDGTYCFHLNNDGSVDASFTPSRDNGYYSTRKYYKTQPGYIDMSDRIRAITTFYSEKPAKPEFNKDYRVIDWEWMDKRSMME